MADFFNRLFSRFSNTQDDYEYEDDYVQDEPIEIESALPAQEIRPGPFRRAPAKVVDFRNPPSASQQQVVILQPSDIETAQLACDHIRSGKTVICNIEKVDPKVAQRVIDFITGGAYSLDGRVMAVSSVIFVVAPRNTTLIEGNTNSTGMEYIRQVVAR